MHRHGRIIDNIKCFRMTVNDNSIGCFFIKIFSLPTPKLLLVLQINWFDAFDQATTDRDDCCHPVFKASKLFYFLLIILSHISFHFWGLQRCFLIKDRGKGRKTTLIKGGGGEGGNHPDNFPVRFASDAILKSVDFSLHSRKKSVSFPPLRYMNRRQPQDYL